jgi:hypothetical protein
MRFAFMSYMGTTAKGTMAEQKHSDRNQQQQSGGRQGCEDQQEDFGDVDDHEQSVGSQKESEEGESQNFGRGSGQGGRKGSEVRNR